MSHFYNFFRPVRRRRRSNPRPVTELTEADKSMSTLNRKRFEILVNYKFLVLHNSIVASKCEICLTGHDLKAFTEEECQLVYDFYSKHLLKATFLPLHAYSITTIQQRVKSEQICKSCFEFAEVFGHVVNGRQTLTLSAVQDSEQNFTINGETLSQTDWQNSKVMQISWTKKLIQKNHNRAEAIGNCSICSGAEPENVEANFELLEPRRDEPTEEPVERQDTTEVEMTDETRKIESPPEDLFLRVCSYCFAVCSDSISRQSQRLHPKNCCTTSQKKTKFEKTTILLDFREKDWSRNFVNRWLLKEFARSKSFIQIKGQRSCPKLVMRARNGKDYAIAKFQSDPEILFTGKYHNFD